MKREIVSGIWYDSSGWRESPPKASQCQRVVSMPVGTVARSWRKCLRFSVRGLIVLVLFIGVGLGLMVRSAHMQREAVASIRNDRGDVGYDWGVKNGNPIAGKRPWAPKWLTDLLGVDYFGHAVEVSLLSESTATDATMTQVGRLTRLERLYLDDSSVGDVGLAHAKGLVGLYVLSLQNTLNHCLLSRICGCELAQGADQDCVIEPVLQLSPSENRMTFSLPISPYC
jgi:hypothetical protein